MCVSDLQFYNHEITMSVPKKLKYYFHTKNMSFYEWEELIYRIKQNHILSWTFPKESN